MNTAEVHTWIEEITALWWLIPAALSFVNLRRRFQGRTGFTESDWLFLFGHSREVVISRRLVLRFAALWLAVVAVGFAIAVYILPYGLGWFAGAVGLSVAGILLIVPRWLR